MGKYHIRRYEDRDYEAARTMFSRGINEHAPAGFRHVLSSPRTHLLLLAVLLTTYLGSSSLLLSLGAVATLLAVGWILMKGFWAEYVHEALASDMKDIRQAYLVPKDCNFWVAEAGGEVAGIVAATHPEDPSLRGRALELKRMSVAKEHRGHGLSKALTRTVLLFAQEHGYKEVVLGTSMVQVAAQRTYEGLGFRRVKEIFPTVLCKLLRFYIYIYRYEIGGSH
ncbi:N-acetyltransferase family 8 member 3 [Zootoca vivipara]|uniref:N-acetyltransferase family 8 member 3 n=1 Tax=Zootoca vivipara TaxID=8524 RepID=UPI00293BD3C9|nr:N-acetyltransferase family 8 member 3 [Zootoca vivipara]